MNNSIWLLLRGWWDRARETEVEKWLVDNAITHQWGDYAVCNGTVQRKIVFQNCGDAVHAKMVWT